MHKCSRYLAFGIAVLVVSIHASAQEAPTEKKTISSEPTAYGTANALDFINEFIAYASLDDPAFRKEPKLCADPSNPPTGRLVALSDFAGYFSYVPKTYDDLTPEQRELVLQDARFHRYMSLLRMRNDAVGKVTKLALAKPAPLPPPEKKITSVLFYVAPDELLSPDTLVVSLPEL